MKFKRIIGLVVLLFSIASGVKVNAQESVETITVATGNSFKPYVYLDENGQLQGYDKAVLDAIDERLPQYEFVYETYEFKNILTTLEAGKAQIATHQYAKNPEREAKFLFGDVGFMDFSYYITVAKDRDDIEILTDLEGKKLSTGSTSNVAALIQDYNETHDGQIDIVYSEGTNETTVRDLTSGVVDAIIVVSQVADELNRNFGDQIKKVGEPILNSEVYFIFEKDNTTLQQAVDTALKELKEDGTLAKISTEILGDDYTSSN